MEKKSVVEVARSPMRNADINAWRSVCSVKTLRIVCSQNTLLSSIFLGPYSETMNSFRPHPFCAPLLRVSPCCCKENYVWIKGQHTLRSLHMIALVIMELLMNAHNMGCCIKHDLDLETCFFLEKWFFLKQAIIIGL